jgi:hypothetical protein
MSIGELTFWFFFGCTAFIVALAGFISTLMTKPAEFEVKVVKMRAR